MEDTIDVIIEVGRLFGSEAARRFAEGRPILSQEDRLELLVPCPELEEALSDIDADPDEAITFQDAAAVLGRTIPNLMLAVRATEDYDKRKSIISVLDSALIAHQKLQEWASRLGQYHPQRSQWEPAYNDYQRLVASIKDVTAHARIDRRPED